MNKGKRIENEYLTSKDTKGRSYSSESNGKTSERGDRSDGVVEGQLTSFDQLGHYQALTHIK